MICLEYAGSEQTTHIQLFKPGTVQNPFGQFKSQGFTRYVLGPPYKVLLMLQGGEALQYRNYGIERSFYPLFIVVQACILHCIHKRMPIAIPHQRSLGLRSSVRNRLMLHSRSRCRRLRLDTLHAPGQRATSSASACATHISCSAARHNLNREHLRNR